MSNTVEMFKQMVLTAYINFAKKAYPNNERMQRTWFTQTGYLVGNGKHAMQTGAFHPDLKRFCYPENHRSTV